MLPNISKESHRQRNHTTHKHCRIWFTNQIHQTFTRKENQILAIIKNKLATNTITQRKPNHSILPRRQIKMTEWIRNGARVHTNGKGASFNCTNIATAKQLQTILQNYENNTILNKNIQEQYDRINKQIIQLKLSIGTLTEEINTLHETIQTLQVKQ